MMASRLLRCADVCAYLLQLICLMGIRKLMDFAFSPIEMYWLDHMLPGEDRVKKEDEMVSKYYSILLSLSYT